MTETPNHGIPLVPQGTLDPAAGLNDALQVIDALLQTAVLSMALTTPPASSADGDLYIVASPATGAWAGQELNLARYVFEGNFWQFYTAGEQVVLVLNYADLGLYKFSPGSPGSWTLAAGLGDAPNDGEKYVRQSAAWVTGGLLVVQDQQSPPTVIDPVEVVIFGDGLDVTDLGSGVVLVESSQEFPEVVEESGTTRTAIAGDASLYVRFTNAAAKTYTFNDGNGYTKGQEFHGRNHGAADLTLVATTGMTINAPAGGSLVIPQGGTFTVKIVSDDGDEADLFGMTDAP
jgi:hypothetical protein